MGSLNFDNFNMSKVYNEQSSRYYPGNKSIRSFNFLREQVDNKPKELDEAQDTFDFLGTHGSYQSDEDEDYSEKEDLIQNKRFYQKDIYKPFDKSIPKTEIEYLLKEQG